MKRPTKTFSRRSATRKGLRSKRGSRTGAAMVEFAIIANLMFVVIFTCMEFARMNMVRNMAQDAAYFAARIAIVPGATADEATTEASRLMDSMISSDGYTVDVGDVNSESGEIVVTVSVDLDSVALFAPMFLPQAIITTTARMRAERYDGFYEQ